VRVTGVGDADISDVVCTIDGRAQQGKNPRDSALTALTKKRNALKQRRRTLHRIASALDRYSSSLRAEHIQPGAADEFFDKYLTRASNYDDKKTEMDDEIRQLGREIEEVKKNAAAHIGQTNARVTVTVHAEQATEIELRLTYSFVSSIKLS
jgi:prefoldin subunit 5